MPWTPKDQTVAFWEERLKGMFPPEAAETILVNLNGYPMKSSKVGQANFDEDVRRLAAALVAFESGDD